MSIGNVSYRLEHIQWPPNSKEVIFSSSRMLTHPHQPTPTYHPLRSPAHPLTRCSPAGSLDHLPRDFPADPGIRAVLLTCSNPTPNSPSKRWTMFPLSRSYVRSVPPLKPGLPPVPGFRYKCDPRLQKYGH
ncbi:hypothetical protein AAMO2058_000224700 [Amorphochlora amoebiformis]